jgi:hypothetical protein
MVHICRFMNSDFPKIEATIKEFAIDVEEDINIQD